MKIGSVIAILGIWGAVAATSFSIGPGAVVMAFIALFATAIVAASD